MIIPYSGKFSHGAKFRTFRGWVGYRENKNCESLNVLILCVVSTQRRHEIKTTIISTEVILAKARKFAPEKISRYTVLCLSVMENTNQILRNIE